MDFTKYSRRYHPDPSAKMSSSNKKMKHVRLEKQYITRAQQIENGQKQNINSNFNKEAIQLLFRKSELQLKNKNLLKYQTEKIQETHFNDNLCLNSQEKQNNIDAHGDNQRKKQNYSRKQENRDQHRPEISSIQIASRVNLKDNATDSSIKSYLQLNVTWGLEKIRKYMSDINQAIGLIQQDVKVINQKSQSQLNNKIKKFHKIRRLLNIVHKFVVDKNQTINDEQIKICDNQCESQVITPQFSQDFDHNNFFYIQKLPHEQILPTMKKQSNLKQSSQAIKNYQQILKDQTQIQNQNGLQSELPQTMCRDYQSKISEFETNHFSPKISTIYQPPQTIKSIQIFEKYDLRSPQHHANEQTKKQSQITNFLYQKSSNIQCFDKKLKLSILSNVMNYHGIFGYKDQFSIPNLDKYNKIIQYQEFEEKVVKKSTVLSTKSLNLCIHALNLAFFLFKNGYSCSKQSYLQQNQLRTNFMYFHDDIREKSGKKSNHKQISHLKLNSISKKSNKQNTYPNQKYPSTCQTSKESLQIRQTLVVIKNKIRRIARQSQSVDRKSQTKRKLFETNEKDQYLSQAKNFTDNSIKSIKKRDQTTLTTLIELYEEAKSVFKKLQERAKSNKTLSKVTRKKNN